MWFMLQNTDMLLLSPPSRFSFHFFIKFPHISCLSSFHDKPKKHHDHTPQLRSHLMPFLTLFLPRASPCSPYFHVPLWAVRERCGDTVCVNNRGNELLYNMKIYIHVIEQKKNTTNVSWELPLFLSQSSSPWYHTPLHWWHSGSFQSGSDCRSTVL